MYIIHVIAHVCGDAGVTPGETDIAEYTRSIERLNTSLSFLQTEMQRLAQQQEKIMAMREQQQQAWVIPPPAPSPHRYHLIQTTYLNWSLTITLLTCHMYVVGISSTQAAP